MYAILAPAKRLRKPLTVDTPGPEQMAGDVVLLRPFLFQQRLGLAVALLLLPVRAHRVAAMVPDHGGGTEPQRPAPFAQPPADVDVVTGDAELRVEPAYLPSP